MMSRLIKIGTRKSPLALAQSKIIADALCAAHDWLPARVKIMPLSTRGDEILDRPLAEIGGKGLFTQELEAGLHNGTLDIAVHSLKDLPTQQIDGLMLACVPPREDPRDVLIIADSAAGVAGGVMGAGGLQNLPHGARIGSASLRRVAQVLHARPDLQAVSLRGNIATRLAKLSGSRLSEAGAQSPHAILLAMAGLNRLGLENLGLENLGRGNLGLENLGRGNLGLENLGRGNRVMQILPPEVMLPAAGQGALGIQIRADDAELKALLAPLHCADTAACVTAERAFLAALEGSCHTPIAALAEIKNERLILTTRLMSEAGDEMEEVRLAGKISDAAALGLQAAREMKNKAPHLVPHSV